VDHPELFDAVVLDDRDRVQEIQVKRPGAASSWIWGAFKLTGEILRDLYALWTERRQQDEYIGTLVNAWIDLGGVATGVRGGRSYVDGGTVRGYREAVLLLSRDDGEAGNGAPGGMQHSDAPVSSEA
jgi:hypothetical protein